MKRIVIVKDMLYLCDNEKGKKYVLVISQYESGKTHTDVIFLHNDIYDKMYAELMKNEYYIESY